MGAEPQISVTSYIPDRNLSQSGRSKLMCPYCHIYRPPQTESLDNLLDSV